MDIDAVYAKVRKKAKKCYQASVNIGENPYVLALDSIIKDVEIMTEINIGLIDIPLKKIVGTKTYSRSVAFAKNFMPLIQDGTEFSAKWCNLYEAHLDEGIKHSIIVYEYLNKFYVLEGNKRVSVLKLEGAISVNAEVIRLIPKKNESNKIYYEFLHFYDKTKINYIWFSRENCFNLLLDIIDKYNINVNDNTFKSGYLQFEKIYHSIDGQKLRITTGDAYLEYLQVYGFDSEITEYQLKTNIKAIWPELEILAEKESIQLQTEPEKESKKNFISNIAAFTYTKRKIKVAFVYAKEISESGWVYSHELGRMYINDVYKDQIETCYFENVPEDETAYDYLVDLVKLGNEVIFTTSPEYIKETLRAALEFPHVKFLNCSENVSYKSLKTYFGRMYEPKFLAGMVAGSMTHNNLLGYVAAHPTPEAINCINSYILGAKFVNPFCKMKVIFSGKWDSSDVSREVDEKLMKSGVDIISSQESITPRKKSREYGVYTTTSMGIQRHKLAHDYLALPIWDWGVFYEKLINSILNGSWTAMNAIFSNETKAINYWWGMDASVVDIIYSNTLVPISTKKTIEFMKRMIIHGEYHPFTGPIYDNNNNLKVEDGYILTNQEILTMDWFVEGVEILG